MIAAESRQMAAAAGILIIQLARRQEPVFISVMKIGNALIGIIACLIISSIEPAVM